MDCPTCGRTSPPEALNCNCGYDFKEAPPSDTPGWPIDASWQQRLAASWSIFWPAFFLPLVIGLIVPGFARLAAISIGANMVFFGIQALLTHRVVHKDYRSFRIYVLRPDGQKSRKLAIRDAGLVWLWIMGPQLALVLFVSAAGWWAGSKLPPGTVQSIGSLALWIRVLWAGPYGLKLALQANYPGFRLQAYGHKY